MTEATIRPYRLAFGGLLALATAMGVGRFVYTPILPAMVDELGLTQSQAGLIASANFLGYLIGALIAALPMLAGSRRGWLIGGLFASGLTTGLMAFATTMPPFLLLRFAGGVASAFVLVFSSALVLDRLARAGHGSLASIHFAGVGAGIATSAALIAGLIALDATWDMLWIAGAAISLVATAAVAWMIPGGDDPTPNTAPAAGSGGRGLAVLIASYGLFGFGYVITATFIVAIVRGSAEIAPLEPVIWIIVGLAGIPSIAIWAMIDKRIGTLNAYVAACLVESLSVAISVMWQTPAMLVLSAVLFGGTFMAIVALGIAAARRMSDGNAQRILALMTASFGLGQIAGPAFAGVVFDMTGSFVWPSAIAALVLVVAGAMVRAFVPR